MLYCGDVVVGKILPLTPPFIKKVLEKVSISQFKNPFYIHENEHNYWQSHLRKVSLWLGFSDIGSEDTNRRYRVLLDDLDLERSKLNSIIEKRRKKETRNKELKEILKYLSDQELDSR